MPVPTPPRPRQLIVEGKDDEHVILHLMMRHGYEWKKDSPVTPRIEAAGGLPQLIEQSSVAAKSCSRLGLVLDADDNLLGHWASLKNRLMDVNIALPAAPSKGGTIVDGFRNDWAVGVWLMPDNVLRGSIEHFLEDLVPSEDELWGYAKEATQEAKARGAHLPPSDLLKGSLHAWLAWQEVPGRPYGTALTAEYFRHNTETANAFVEWFNQLFA